MAREADGSGKRRRINHKIALAKSIIRRSKFTSLHKHNKKKLHPEEEEDFYYLNKDFYNLNNYPKIGDTIDIMGLLFSPQRDFLINNNGHKVRADDLKGKTIVLYVVSWGITCYEPFNTLDMIEAYNELLPMGDIEFVFVAVQIAYPSRFVNIPTPEEVAYYIDRLFSTMPFPAIPMSDKPGRDRVLEAFRVLNTVDLYLRPYWSIIDSSNTVVASSKDYDTLFNVYGGAELYPLTRERIYTLWHQRHQVYPQLSDLDQQLASPTRDFLLSSNGLDKVPISSLKDKVIGLYFCVNVPNPPHMELIAKVYEGAKLRGYNFEIVQINFHFYHLPMRRVPVEDMLVPQNYQNINWLTLPFKDPSCRKVQRIFYSSYVYSDYGQDDDDLEDCLVIVQPDDDDDDDTEDDWVEFDGIKLIELYGIEGYPFKRKPIYELEQRSQRESLKLKLIFPPGECHLIRPTSDGYDVIDSSLLSGKRVLVLFASQCECQTGKYVSMLESKYYAQLREVKEKESKFEVVYVSCDPVYYRNDEYSFYECIKDMPWLVYPYSKDFALKWRRKIFKSINWIGLAAFDVNGELMAKKAGLDSYLEEEEEECHKLPFPFIPSDLNEEIRKEVDLRMYHPHTINEQAEFVEGEE